MIRFAHLINAPCRHLAGVNALNAGQQLTVLLPAQRQSPVWLTAESWHEQWRIHAFWGHVWQQKQKHAWIQLLLLVDRQILFFAIETANWSFSWQTSSKFSCCQTVLHLWIDMSLGQDSHMQVTWKLFTEIHNKLLKQDKSTGLMGWHPWSCRVKSFHQSSMYSAFRKLTLVVSLLVLSVFGRTANPENRGKD